MYRMMTILLVSVMTLSGNALASGDHGYSKHHDGLKGHRKRDHHFPGHLQRMVKKLDLDESQKEKIQAIFKQTRSKMKALRDQMGDKRKRMYEMMHADDADEAKVVALAEELGKLKTEKMVLYARTHIKINKLLTPAQRKKMQAMHKKHHKRDK